MERSWFRFSLHGETIIAPLTAEQVSDLQALGVDLEPASKPDDIEERLAPVVQLLLSSWRLTIER